MQQIIYNINENMALEQAIAQVKKENAYHAAKRKLVQIYETAWEIGEIERHIRQVREGLPDVEIVGVTQTDSRELINGYSYTYPGITVLFQFFETSDFEILSFEADQYTPVEAAKAFLKKIEGLPDIKGVQMFLSDTALDWDPFFDILQEKEYDYPYFGIVAGSSNSFRINGDKIAYLFTERVLNRGLLAVVYYGKQLHIRTKYLYGWKPIGQRFMVTKKSDLFQVQTIDNKPAAMLFKKYFGLRESQIKVENLCEFPFVVKRGKYLAGRIGLKGGTRGSVMFGIPVREGEELQFSYGNLKEILYETMQDMNALAQFEPQGVLLIPCLNRKIVFRNENKDEMGMYQFRFSNVGQLYGNGEIYMDKDGGGLVASALITVGFREGEGHCFCCGVCEEQKLRKLYEIYMSEPYVPYVPLEKRLMQFMITTTQDLEDAVIKADVANKAKSDFLSRMSHEIRTPINAVLGMDEMILRESEEPQIRDYAMDIYTAGNSLLSLINDILDISKIESGKMEIIPVEYDLSSMIHDLSAMIVLRAKAKNLHFEVSVDETLPSRLYGDDVRVRQVVTNILTNAVKYTPKGSVYLRISGVMQGEEAELRFEVEDTGIGIKEEDLPKLTQEFERIEEKRNRSIEGTGLGMNITTRLLEMMGSRMQVESVYGKGSKFYFCLKQKVIDKTPIGNFEERLHQLSQEYSYTNVFTAPDAKVLVVDDNHLNLKVFTSLLKQTQIQVTEADSGDMCLRLAADNKYDLIFLDHMMPDMDGIETLHNLKKMQDSPNLHTPVIALTANAVTGAKEMYLSEGFDGFLSKPVVSDKLEQALRKILPQELVQEVKQTLPQTQEEKKEAEKEEELPLVDGLDWNFAKLHLPDRDLLEETVKEFYELIPHHEGKLQAAFQTIQTKAGMEQYRIQVHSMKSVAATIGIIPLAGMANTLEYAARDGKTPVIAAMHDIFCDSWKSYEQKLQGVFHIGEAQKLQMADASMVRAKLEMLKVSMMELDIDTADPIVDELLSYEYLPEIEALMKELKIAVTALEDDRAVELAEQLIEKV